MCLAIFAAKCNIYDVDKVRADAMTLLPHFNSLNPSRPFTEDDVDSALECLDGRYVTFPRADIAKLSNIDIPRNKRNGRKRPQHIAMVNATRKMRRDVFGEDEYKNSGRPRGAVRRQTRYALMPPSTQASANARSPLPSACQKRPSISG